MKQSQSSVWGFRGVPETSSPPCDFITEPVPCQLEGMDPILKHPVAQFVLRMEAPFQHAWDDKAAHPDYRPLPARGTTHAYGQCVPSTALLFKWLAVRFPEEAFSIESGFAHTLDVHRRSPAIQSHTHVWLHWTPASSPGKLEDIHVIDMTASQLPWNPDTVVQSAKKLVLSGMFYQSLRRFHDLESFYEQFSISEPGVRSRVDRLREQFFAAQRKLWEGPAEAYQGLLYNSSTKELRDYP